MATINVRSAYGYDSNGANNHTYIANALTAASPGDTVVFDTNGGADPTWLITDEFLVKDVEDIDVIFEPGVVLEAVSGSKFFTDSGSGENNEILWEMAGWRRVNIYGYGARFHVPRQTGQTNNEAGHSIAIQDFNGAQSPEDINIYGLHLDESNGDGIYLRACARILIEDVFMEKHHRQATSIITCTGEIRFRRCRMSKTGTSEVTGLGTPPKYGIDIEPNSGSNTSNNLVGPIILENCLLDNNDGSGIGMAWGFTTGAIGDVDCQFIDCATYNNSLDHPYDNKAELSQETGSSDQVDPPTGTTVWTRCAVDGSDWTGFEHSPTGKAGKLFTTATDIVLYEVAANGQRQGIRNIRTGATINDEVGNISFDGYCSMAGDDYVFAWRGGGTTRNANYTVMAVNPFNKFTDSVSSTLVSSSISYGGQYTSYGAVPTTTVEVTATTSQAVKTSSQNGVFTFTRTSSKVDYPIFVAYTVNYGTILEYNEVGYLTGYVVIPKNQTSATVDVVARDNGESQANRDLTVTIAARSMYSIGSNSQATVTVVDSATGNTSPVITLTGSSFVQVTQGDSYVDAGATASDAEDGDITGSIVVGGDTVDTNVLGTYVITYNVTDSGGASATEVTRTVQVVAATAGSAFKITRILLPK